MKRVSIIAFALAAAMMAPAWAQTAAAGISGYIVDRDSGSKLPHATVVLQPWAGGPQHRVVTNADGFFSDVTLAPGRYEVAVVNANGYVNPTCTAVRVYYGEVARVHVVTSNNMNVQGILCRETATSTLIDSNALVDVYRFSPNP